MTRQSFLFDQHKERIRVLDGLRFLAAFTVLLAHYASMIVCDQGVQSPLTNVLVTLSGLGMPLFFVLSGFVIHYNYHHIKHKTNGIKEYLIARFTRLYPLYFLLLVIEFYFCFRYHRGSCGHAGERLGLFLALPYYLTLTQDWFYGIIANNNLIYQYHLAASVAWSISLELFFYLAYLFILPFLLKQRRILLLVSAGILTQVCLILFFAYCYRYESTIEKIASIGFGNIATMQHGYQDSLLRWIYYFNPITNLPAFFFGCSTAHLYLVLKNRPFRQFELKWVGMLVTTLSLIIMLCLHFMFYSYLAPTNAFIGRTASSLIAPAMAVLIFCLARYPFTIWNRLLSKSFFVKLGEASYSIYLLHAFFGFHWRKLYHFHLNPWLLYVIAVICILVISRISFLIFERPVQKWLRNKMLGKKEPIHFPVTSQRIVSASD